MKDRRLLPRYLPQQGCEGRLCECGLNAYTYIRKSYHELIDHPKTGIGHPEALKRQKEITWSRHMTGLSMIFMRMW